MPSGPISSINGCFLWYESSSFNSLPSGNVINYWPDLSLSGNNLTPYGTSGSAPILITNSLNGYPSVLFSGSQGLIANNNSSLELTNNNLTLFSVFATTGTAQQVISSLDSPVTESRISFIEYLDTSNNLSFQDSSNIVSFTSGVSPGNFIIRTDRFDSSSNFYIEYFNQPVASSTVISMTAVGTPNFYVGYAPYSLISSNLFEGYLVEIVGYGLPLSDSDKNSVYNYLYNKYFTSSSGGSPPSFHNPSDLSGLFAWYRSTSIGLTGVDSSPVQYWPDDSGSGNNLFVLQTQSGIWQYPQFYRNIIHQYPIVRFTNFGNNSFLSTNGFNQSFNFSPGDFTGFCVFKAGDLIDPQVIYSIDDSAGGTTTNLAVGLNSIQNDFSFWYGSGGINQVINASSTTFGTNVYDYNTTTIRHDRFIPNSTVFSFGLFGSDISSGNATTHATATNSINVGISQKIGYPFIGDIAEIVMYRRRLSGAETELVNTYLTNKYLPNNTNITNLFIYSTSNSSIYTSADLYALGAYSGATNNTTLYVGSTLLNNSGMSLYEFSVIALSGNTPLYTAGSFQQYPPITLFLGANFISSGAIPLYTQSANQYLVTSTLYMSGSYPVGLNNIPLYTTSYNEVASGYVPLYTAGSFQQYPPITLYTLSVGTGLTNNNHIYAYISGTTNPSSFANTTLFLANVNSPGSNASGLYAAMPLYLEAGHLYSSLPLYIQTVPEDKNPSGYMPLFVGDPYASGYWREYTPLFLGNYAASVNSITKRLYINGLGSLAGGQSLLSAMDLFLYNNQIAPVGSSGFAGYFTYRYFDSNYLQSDYFALEGNTPVGSALIQNSAPLYIGSAGEDPSGIPLYITSFSQPQINITPGYNWQKYMTTLYFQIDYFDLLEGGGINLQSSGISLFISGSGTANQPGNFTIYTRGF